MCRVTWRCYTQHAAYRVWFASDCFSSMAVFTRKNSSLTQFSTLLVILFGYIHKAKRAAGSSEETDLQWGSGRVTSSLPVVDPVLHQSEARTGWPCCLRHRACSDTSGPSSPETQICRYDSAPCRLRPSSNNIQPPETTRYSCFALSALSGSDREWVNEWVSAWICIAHNR